MRWDGGYGSENGAMEESAASEGGPVHHPARRFMMSTGRSIHHGREIRGNVSTQSAIPRITSSVPGRERRASTPSILRADRAQAVILWQTGALPARSGRGPPSLGRAFSQRGDSSSNEIGTDRDRGGGMPPSGRLHEPRDDLEVPLGEGRCDGPGSGGSVGVQLVRRIEIASRQDRDSFREFPPGRPGLRLGLFSAPRRRGGRHRSATEALDGALHRSPRRRGNDGGGGSWASRRDLRRPFGD